MLTNFDLMYMGRGYARLGMYANALDKWGFKYKKLVLDAGCGFGAWTYALSTMSGHVVGVESDTSRGLIAKHILEERARDIEIEQRMITDYCISKENKFDAILCYHTIYYTDDWKTTLNALCGVMKPNGIMYINIATFACFLYMAQSNDDMTRMMGISAINNERRRKKGEQYSTEDGLPIDQHEFESELARLGLAIKWTGNDEIACHPGVIGYVLERVHNDM
jgi:SAM-dependent methyltransferase